VTSTNLERMILDSVLIPFGLGWKQFVVIENSHTKAEVEVIFDYDNLPIRCKFCFNVATAFVTISIVVILEN
jgi:hypothetical protein